MRAASRMLCAIACTLAGLVGGAADAGPDAPVALRPGDPMPHFIARRLDPARPDTLSTRDLPAGPVVISFVASYCKPCRAEVPRLVTLAAAHPSWQVVLVVLDREPAGLSAARRWLLEESAVTLPVVRDRFSLIGRRFGVQSLPHVVAFDATRGLVWQGVGAGTADLEPLADALAVPTP